MTIEKTTLDRRAFLRSSVMAGGGLVLGLSWLASAASAVEKATDVSASEWANFNAFLKIGEDGRVTIFSPNPEGGQGVLTAMPMIVAEELDVDWKNVVVEQAPLDTKLYSRQYMGGSNSIRSGWNPLRKAGATARQMLREAAAQSWHVPVGEVTTAKGVLHHKSSGKSATYGELATAAASIPVPADVELKAVKDFAIIGTSPKNVVGKEIVTGKPLFGYDIQEEDMRIAMIVHPPAFGMKLKSFNASSVKTMPGIKDVFQIKVFNEDYVWEHFDTVTFNELVAIVGNSTWEVMNAKLMLEVEWEQIQDHTITRNDYYAGKQELNIPSKPENSDWHKSASAEMAAQPGNVLRKDGNPEDAFRNAAKIIESTFIGPWLAHNNMEPYSFFAHVTDEWAKLKGPNQKPGLTVNALSHRLGMPVEKIEVEMTRMGGAFGRRSYAHWMIEAALISQHVKAPVKLVYSREDDMTGGIYRPYYRADYRAALDKNNKLIAFHVKAGGLVESPLINPNLFPAGAVDNYLAESWQIDSNITIGSYRAPRSNFMAVAEQSFLDEVAEAAGIDPIEFRLELLDRVKTNPVGERVGYDADRLAGVIKLLKEKAGTGQAGVHRGVSAYFAHGTYVAQALDIIIEKGKPKTKNVCCTVDCGIVINPDGLKNQAEGSIVDGIGVAMYGNLTFTNGVPDQNNFDTYEMIRYGDPLLPETIDIHFVESEVDPTGMGEPAFPPIMAALANALYKAKGKRLYSQPFVNDLG